MGKSKKNYLRDARSPIPLNSKVSKIMSANKGKGTKPELLLRKALWGAGLKGYRLNWSGIPGRPDIAFVKRRLAIFIHGCFWHRCEKCKPKLPKTNTEFWERKFLNNKKRDIVNFNALISLGWIVLVVWECEIKHDIQSVVGMVKNKFLL